jgi:type II secretory pathway component PulJ
MQNDSGHKQNAPAQLKMEERITNDIFPYRTHTMQMLLLMQRDPPLLLYPKEKEREGKKEERREEGREKGKKKSSVNDMKKRQKEHPQSSTSKHEDAQTTRYSKIRSIS